MSDLADSTSGAMALRQRAAARLGAAVERGALGRAGDALTVLYELASSPATAADALALLHELQVHQVELDLQAEELRESRVAAEAALRREVALYDFQPVGCLTIDAATIMRRLNLAAARMLGIAREEAVGLPLERFLAPGSAHALRESMARGRPGSTSEPWVLPLSWKDDADHVVSAHVGADPGEAGFLVVLGNPKQRSPHARR